MSIQTRYVKDLMGSVAEDVEALAELPGNMVRAGENALKMGHAHSLDMLHTIRGENDIYILSEVERLKHYNGNYDVGVISNSLGMMYNESIVQGGQLADLYLGGKDSKFTRIPFPGKDYDIHMGINTNFGALSGSYGSDGPGLNYDVNPSLGADIYFSVLKRGKTPLVITSGGYKFLNGSLIVNRDKKIIGAGFSIGPNLPLTPVPANVSIEIPIEKKSYKKITNEI